MAIHASSTTTPAVQPRGLLRPRPAMPSEPLLGAYEAYTSRRLIQMDDATAGLMQTDEPALARALHARRELRNALEHGFALLDALGLPPLALDAIDDGIAALDRMDAAQEDIEDDDPLEDGGDAEPSLGSLDRWPSQVGWAGGGDDDREDGDDNGIADLDGYHELFGAALGLTLPFSIGGYVA